MEVWIDGCIDNGLGFLSLSTELWALGWVFLLKGGRLLVFQIMIFQSTKVHIV